MSVALAVLSAAVFAIAAAMQHRVVRELALAPTERGLARLLPRLVRQPWWLAGLAGNLLGFVLHAAALRVGDLGVVQAVLVLQLLFALPLGTGRLTARDWLSTVAISAAVANLIVLRASVAPAVAPYQGTVPLIGGISMAALVSLSRLPGLRAPIRSALVGTAAGVGFSITATFISAVARRVGQDGLWRSLPHAPTIGLCLSGAVAAVLVQQAYTIGSLPVALTAMTVADPIASWVWSLLFLDSSGGLTLAQLASYLVSAVALAVGSVALINSPASVPAAAPRICVTPWLPRARRRSGSRRAPAGVTTSASGSSAGRGR
jgi:hypothetical protein